MLSGTRERVSIQANAEIPKRASPSHTQPFPMAFSASEVPRSFALDALRVIPCLRMTCPDAAKATAKSRTAKLLKLNRALLTCSPPRPSSSQSPKTPPSEILPGFSTPVTAGDTRLRTTLGVVTAQVCSWMRCTSMQSLRVVVLVGLTAFLAKMPIIVGTYGTQDIHTWTGFALGVTQRGPVGIYGIDFEKLNGTLYNHPPLVGYYLELVNTLSQWGVPLRVTIRAVASASDVISGVLVFEILRRRNSLLRATLSGIAVAASPVLFLISGYHGNTDPLFVMLIFLGSFLIIDKRMAFLGGVSLGLAIGVKLVPIVAFPTIAVYLVRHRRDLLLRAATGFGATLAVTWIPVILGEWDGLKANVLGYVGNKDRPWGLVQIAEDLSWSGASQVMIGPGRYVALLLCAAIPAVLTWQKPQFAMESVAVSLVAFLILSPAFGVQYLAWAVAAAYLLDFWSATLYNLAGGLFLYQIYDFWNAGLPWSDIAWGGTFNSYQIAMAGLLWIFLIIVLMRGARLFRAVGEELDIPEPDHHA